ncbi:MAG: phytoene desaturase family protein [Agriterribacter sp.]
MKNQKKATVIGAGFAGLSAATCLADKGFDVTVFEKNDQPGGRARVLREPGFTFDMGPSWYWMPDVIEKYFNRFKKTGANYFHLTRLDPSYQVIVENNRAIKIPASQQLLEQTFESIEKGSAAKLKTFLAEAKYKYEAGINEFVYKPSVSIKEYADWRMLKALFRLDMFSAFSAHIRQYFKHPHILQILEFPVLFLGAMPSKTPALYSMMNYADICLGTWYPHGGFHKLVEAMAELAVEKGVKIKLNSPVAGIKTANGMAKGIITGEKFFETDYIIGAADYHHIESQLLEKEERSYSEEYWQKKTFAPSCLIFYIGVNKKLPRLLHHNLFFQQDFTQHAKSIYKTKTWPENPLFYVCCTSKTDENAAPAGMENLFVLIPVATGLSSSPSIEEKYFDFVISRVEKFCGEAFSKNIIFKKSYSGENFLTDYNAYKGNAYGLANTLRQTAFMKPSIRSKKIKNLFFAGQLTVPGPGVPPAIISGQVVADYILSKT